jgi:hypothetical protein
VYIQRVFLNLEIIVRVHHIKNRHIMAVSKELLDEMTADEASTTRDKYMHYHSVLSGSKRAIGFTSLAIIGSDCPVESAEGEEIASL